VHILGRRSGAGQRFHAGIPSTQRICTQNVSAKARKLIAEGAGVHYIVNIQEHAYGLGARHSAVIRQAIAEASGDIHSKLFLDGWWYGEIEDPRRRSQSGRVNHIDRVPATVLK
jgi:hypothetical protein